MHRSTEAERLQYIAKGNTKFYHLRSRFSSTGFTTTKPHSFVLGGGLNVNGSDIRPLSVFVFIKI